MIKTFLPAIGNEGITLPPIAQGESNPDFIRTLFNLMANAVGQMRAMLVLNVQLTKAAMWHAIDMATRGYFAHETPDGIWPNKMARNAGYRLPESYPDDKNYIESIAGGYDSPQAAWAALIHSESHSKHLLGLTDFFKAQTMVGIGYYHMPESTFQHYYCICSAPPEVIL